MDRVVKEEYQEYWKAAQVAGGISGISPVFIFCQWAHESALFTSELCREYHNYAGVTQVEPNGIPQPDGRFYYKKFDDLSSWARYFGCFIRLFDGTTEAQTIEEYATALKNEGYYGDTLDNYIEGMQSAYAECFV